MGAGYSMMNELTIIQTTQGLTKYLLASNSSVKRTGVAIGYDGRHNSRRFAWLAATIFINAEIPVYLFSKLCPTPYVPYSVSHYGLACGIMVTASHNPKEDNGYKVYWSNGAQIVSPIDKGIANSILENLEPWESSWDTSVVDKSPLRNDPLDEVWKLYNEDVKKLCYHRDKNSSCPIKFTYTAMHGVGYRFVIESFKSFGFTPPVPVKKQVEPDPEFPTVKYPNPEEGKGALELSVKTANENDSTVILANDPDADRLAVAEKQPSGEWKIFTGNELGALVGWWCWFTYTQKHPDVPASQLHVLSSTVSSKIMETIASREGFNFEETLTGFKWMGCRSHSLKKEGKTVLFAFEEAIGYMCGSTVLDKDGVSCAAVCAEMACYLNSKNTTLSQQLENIYSKYGYHLSSNSYFICHDSNIIKQMFENLRNYNSQGTYPSTCGPYKIKYVRDLTVGYDNSQPDGKPLLPVSSSSQMITFTFDNGCVATLRTSGTEPKIKYYTEHRPDPNKGMDRVDAQNELDDIVQHIITYFFQPEKYGLIPKAN